MMQIIHIGGCPNILFNCAMNFEIDCDASAWQRYKCYMNSFLYNVAYIALSQV